MKLIEVGAPIDEYDSEVAEIYREINQCATVDELHKLICEIFQSQFSGSAGSKDSYADLAQELWKACTAEEPSPEQDA